MDADHPKLQAFQEAVRVALQKRIEDEKMKIKHLQQEKEAKTKLKLQKTKELHESQRGLKAEEARLMEVTEQAHDLAEVRRKLDEANRRDGLEIRERAAELREADARRNEVQERLNRILLLQIRAESRRVATAGDVSAGHTGLTKTEADFKAVQEGKKGQDLYMERLQGQLEELEQRELEYQEQTTAMQMSTEEIRSTVRKAEKEVEAVRKEKGNLLQRWTSTVINISKRDEAIQTFQEALSGQRLELKKTRSQIVGTKREIVEHQEDHDHLTAVGLRLERLSSNRKNQIKHAEEAIADTGRELHKATRAKHATFKTLEATEVEVKVTEREIGEVRKEVERLDGERSELEDLIYMLCRDQNTAEKTSKFADKVITSVREERAALEDRVSEAQNGLSVTLQEIMNKHSVMGKNTEVELKLRGQTEELHRQLDKVEQALHRGQALVDKKQNLIDLRQRQKVELESAKEGEGANPLEAELARVKKEIQEVTNYCNDAKAAWIKCQREVIETVAARSELEVRVTDKTRKFLIMQEKKRKLEREMEQMEAGLGQIRRRIEAKDGHVKRMGEQQAEEAERYGEAAKLLETKHIADAETLEAMNKTVEELHEVICGLHADLEAEKRSALEAEDVAGEWEGRVKAAKDTLSEMNLIKGRDGDLENLRGEVHKLKVRAEQVDRQTRSLMEDMKVTVARRETLVDKAANLAVIRQAKSRPQLNKTLNGKRADDLRARAKKLSREEKELALTVKEREWRHEEIKKELDKRAAFLKKIRESCESLKVRAEEEQDAKDVGLAEILQLQTRAKWYRSVKERKYRLATGGGGGGNRDDLETLRSQNRELKQSMNELQKEFPYLQHNLRRLRNMVI